MNKELINTAIKMRENAHAPYSNYKVGAAVETLKGEIIGGCNVESSSYGLTCCAERTALFRAISEGYKNFRSLAVSSNNGGMPCGACRQVIWDICKEIEVHICNNEERLKTINKSMYFPL